MIIMYIIYTVTIPQLGCQRIKQTSIKCESKQMFFFNGIANNYDII